MRGKTPCVNRSLLLSGQYQYFCFSAVSYLQTSISIYDLQPWWRGGWMLNRHLFRFPITYLTTGLRQASTFVKRHFLNLKSGAALGVVPDSHNTGINMYQYVTIGWSVFYYSIFFFLQLVKTSYSTLTVVLRTAQRKWNKSLFKDVVGSTPN